jgi:biotin carboxyl carrier protein
LVKRYRVAIGTKTFDVEVGDPQEVPLTVIVDGETFVVDMQPHGAASAPSPDADETLVVGPEKEGEAGPSQVIAPMPGTILNIAVQPGDSVQRDQVLCSLEAMKMKSPIRALRSGTVRQVQVQDGQTVDYGDLLFVVT